MLRLPKNQPETPKSNLKQGKASNRPSTTRASVNSHKSFNGNLSNNADSIPTKSSLILNSSTKFNKSTTMEQSSPSHPKVKINPLLNLGRTIHHSSMKSKGDPLSSTTNSSINNISLNSSNVQIKKLQFTTRPSTSKNTTVEKNEHSMSTKSLQPPESSLLTDRNMWKTLEVPATPASVLKSFIGNLTDYEKGEILKYSCIYYIGIDANKVRPNAKSEFNYGYDNENGDYNIVNKDHIAYRYEVIDRIGKGSFGQVLKVFDHKRKNVLALKIIKNKARFQKQAEVEIEVLKFIRKKDEKDKYNIIHIESYFTFRHHVVRNK